MGEVRRRQRLSARALLVCDGEVLLAQIAPGGYGDPGTWTLPGGGVDHGEHPVTCLLRELAEETGLRIDVGELVTVFSERYLHRTAGGEREDHHGVHLVFRGTVQPGQVPPRVVEIGGTTAAVAWTPIGHLGTAQIPVAPVVAHLLGGGYLFGGDG